MQILPLLCLSTPFRSGGPIILKINKNYNSKYLRKLITIITVVYNNVSHIQKTLNSIFSQKYKNYELIVIDGASNDGTLEIQTAAQTRLKMNGTGNVHNLTVNHGSCQLHMESDTSTTIEGNLTITAGTVNTNTEGGASRNLTVTGELSCAGTFTGNASLVTVLYISSMASSFMAIT